VCTRPRVIREQANQNKMKTTNANKNSLCTYESNFPTADFVWESEHVPVRVERQVYLLCVVHKMRRIKKIHSSESCKLARFTFYAAFQIGRRQSNKMVCSARYEFGLTGILGADLVLFIARVDRY